MDNFEILKITKQEPSTTTSLTVGRSSRSRCACPEHRKGRRARATRAAARQPAVERVFLLFSSYVACGSCGSTLCIHLDSDVTRWRSDEGGVYSDFLVAGGGGSVQA